MVWAPTYHKCWNVKHNIITCHSHVNCFSVAHAELNIGSTQIKEFESQFKNLLEGINSIIKKNNSTLRSNSRLSVIELRLCSSHTRIPNQQRVKKGPVAGVTSTDMSFIIRSFPQLHLCGKISSSGLISIAIWKATAKDFKRSNYTPLHGSSIAFYVQRVSVYILECAACCLSVINTTFKVICKY